MLPVTRGSMLVCAIGYSVLVSLAFTALVHFAFALFGAPLAERGVSYLSTISGMLSGGLAAFLYSWLLKKARA